MTRKLLATLVFAGVVAGWLLQPVLAKKKEGHSSSSTLSAVEAADLAFMREEEKLARDVYTTLFSEWGSAVFSHIADSEQKHMDAMLGLLNKYSLEDPAVGFGEFTDPELQELFDSLVATGLKSELEALYVGALIEEVDTEDLVRAMGHTDKTDILNVYGNLLAGSENHLRSFVKNIETITSESYTAQWISQEEVDAILGR